MDIKILLNNILKDKEVLNLTADRDVYFIHADGAKTPYVEYNVVGEREEVGAENTEIATRYDIQVSIFSKDDDVLNGGDYTDLENKVKEKMQQAGFKRIDAKDLFEPDTKYFHKALRFSGVIYK